MFSDWIWDIWGCIVSVFGIGFCWIQQGCGLLEIFFSGKYQYIEFLLVQCWGQVYYVVQVVSGYYVWLLIGKVIVGEECCGCYVLVENQYVWCKNLFMFVQFVVECQGQFIDIGWYVSGGDWFDDFWDIQVLIVGS